MKGKTKTYLLLGAVLIIWGILGFKVVATLSPKPPIETAPDLKVAFRPNYAHNLDTFSIRPPDRDPFLGTLTRPKQITTSALPRKNQAVDTVYVPVTYHGTVSQQHGQIRVFVVSIEGQQYLLKKGQETLGVTLIRGDDTHIVVGYKGITKPISKS